MTKNRGPYKLGAVDLGHINLRVKTADGIRVIPHAIHELGESRWVRAVDRVGQEKPDYVRVNNKYFVVGETARFHGVVKVRMRADRYDRDYYGALLCATLGRLYTPETCPRQFSLFASHPSEDARYSDLLVDSLIGSWTVELAGRDPITFDVVEVQTYDEPLGGLANVIFSGRRADGDLLAQRLLVIDIGGGNTQVLPVMPGFDPDYDRAGTFDLGILDVLHDLERELKEAYRAELRRARTLPPDRLQEALVTGTFDAGGKLYSCGVEVDRALSRYLNDFHRVYQSAGGPIPYDAIILTGGGSAILGHTLIAQVLDHGRVMYADGVDDLDYGHPEDRIAAHGDLFLANVTGGLAMMRAFLDQGIL